MRAGDIGMSFNRQGMMEFDEKKFQAKLDKDYNNVAQVLTGTFTAEGGKTEGFMDNLSGMVNMALRVPDGLVQSRRKTLTSNIDQIDRRIAQKTKYIEEKEKSLKDKFARLEGTISKIRSSGAGLQGMSDPVQQLG
jgi:flagellar hook-associated protein 2